MAALLEQARALEVARLAGLPVNLRTTQVCGHTLEFGDPSGLAVLTQTSAIQPAHDKVALGPDDPRATFDQSQIGGRDSGPSG